MVRVNGFRLEGVLPAVVTPFDKNEEFDEDSFRYLIDWLIEREITGIVPCGTTGEFSLMSQAERAKVIEVCTLAHVVDLGGDYHAFERGYFRR